MHACVERHGAASDDGRARLSGDVVKRVEEVAAERACHRRGGCGGQKQAMLGAMNSR